MHTWIRAAALNEKVRIVDMRLEGPHTYSIGWCYSYIPCYQTTHTWAGATYTCPFVRCYLATHTWAGATHTYPLGRCYLATPAQ